jgi:glycosyltransferase involved in cell wall biosynthesis
LVTTIVRLITRLNIGGPARQALLLTRALRPSYTTILAAGAPTADEGELADDDVSVRYLPFVRPVSPLNDVRALRETRQLLVAERPAIVHTHMAKAGTIGRLAASTIRPRPRTIHTFHGHVLDGYFGRVVQRGFIEAERMLARRTDALIAVSDEVRDDLLELGIGRPDQIRVIRLGLDLTAHAQVNGPSGALRRSLGLDSDEPLVGTVGRLVPIKDHETLIHAMRLVPDAHLAIVGDGELRRPLEALVEQLGLRSRVHFTGWRLDVPAVMADVDVVALSSRNEGTPVSLIEAAACGRPVVATDVGGVRTVVSDGETGYLVPAGDAPALAEQIRTLLADRAMAELMGRTARTSSHRFTAERLVGDIRSLYDELLR